MRSVLFCSGGVLLGAGLVLVAYGPARVTGAVMAGAGHGLMIFFSED